MHLVLKCRRHLLTWCAASMVLSLTVLGLVKAYSTSLLVSPKEVRTTDCLRNSMQRFPPFRSPSFGLIGTRSSFPGFHSSKFPQASDFPALQALILRGPWCRIKTWSCSWSVTPLSCTAASSSFYRMQAPTARGVSCSK